eukprot:SAG31_NODE_436_length_15717_cov_5.420412_11_plen_52_part_00
MSTDWLLAVRVSVPELSPRTPWLADVFKNVLDRILVVNLVCLVHGCPAAIQ